MLIIRTIFGLALLLAVFYAPWGLTLILAFVGTYYFPTYYEVFAAGILFDILYGVTESLYFGYGILGLILSVIIFLGAEKAKYELRS